MTTMETKRKLMPGQPGTKKLIEKYGEKLICVRYRYDPKQKRKIKTIELIVEEGHWEKDSKKIPQNKKVYVRIAYDEIYLRNLVKDSGGKWNRQKRAWELPYRAVVALGLTDRILVAEN